MRTMGQRADVPIEPPEQTALLDACISVAGVIGGGVPGGKLYTPSTFHTPILPYSSANVYGLLMTGDPRSGRIRRDLAARVRPGRLPARRAPREPRRARVEHVRRARRLAPARVRERGQGRARGAARGRHWARGRRARGGAVDT